ncbi:Uncharacterised protein [Kingella potus]|uniref:Uncharacterized protein n=1 Tax=Kingella potus TaxID=265175 RepID=A0A377R1L7_9NEIS|nr:hypothetical protein [Kingella potus]UOP00520.1 hypothetical protein LVJ84_11855 [Kingella potus]UOP02056.1 hypothetical protein LVJ84_14355 [Kingella potus]STQ99856.1 Uncharacterised protein [Kingella potus]STR02401.1 Uncharacterised protein [Kingella potus]
MLRTERVPVTLYTSEDPSAPKLANAAGAFKTILKACLLTGYGAKAAAGWEAAFEGNNKIALRPADPKSPRGLIRIDNGTAGIAYIQAYTAMSGIDSGEAVFNQTQNLHLTDYSYQTRKWWLIACPRGFAFFAEGRGGGCRYLYFGDFPTLSAGDNGNMVCIGSFGQSYGQNIVPRGFYSRGGSAYTFAALLKSYDGLRKGAGANLQTAAFSLYSANETPQEYPSPVSGGFSAFPVYIMEYANSLTMPRGLLPGISAVAERMSAVPVGTRFDQLAGENFICMDFGDGNQRDTAVLVNTSYWEI